MNWDALAKFDRSAHISVRPGPRLSVTIRHVIGNFVQECVHRLMYRPSHGPCTGHYCTSVGGHHRWNRPGSIICVMLSLQLWTQVGRLSSGAAVCDVIGLNWAYCSKKTRGWKWKRTRDIPLAARRYLVQSEANTVIQQGLANNMKELQACANTSRVIMNEECLPERYQVYSKEINCRDLWSFCWPVSQLHLWRDVEDDWSRVVWESPISAITQYDLKEVSYEKCPCATSHVAQCASFSWTFC